MLARISANVSGSIPGARSTTVTNQQQIITFMKALLPMEMESRALDKDFDAYLDSKLSKTEQAVKEADLQKRAKAIVTNANSIKRPDIPEVNSFYNKWLAYQINFDAMLTAFSKGDKATLSDIIDKFPALDKDWREAANVMLVKYNLRTGDIGWPKD
jgi:hypothetical protein